MPGKTINMRLCEQFLNVHLLTLGYGIIKYCVLLIAKTHVHSSRPNIILSDDISFLSLLWGNRVSLEQDPNFCNCMQKPWEHIQVIPLMCCEHGFQFTAIRV